MLELDAYSIHWIRYWWIEFQIIAIKIAIEIDSFPVNSVSLSLYRVPFWWHNRNISIKNNFIS